MPYFELIDKEVIDDKKTFSAKLFELEILRADDTKAEVDYFTSIWFYDLLSLLNHFRPNVLILLILFESIAKLGERFAKDTNLKKMNGNRGSKHFIYMNRTFFGFIQFNV
jgi:hypothetical protein